MIEPSCSASPAQSLDTLINALCSIHAKRADAIDNRFAASDDQYILDEAVHLEQAFLQWEQAQGTRFRPSTIGTINRRTCDKEHTPGFYPGNVDIYFDLYVACIWNIYRAARLYLITLIAELRSTYSTPEPLDPPENGYQFLVSGILSSVPYHLTEDLHDFVQHADMQSSITTPGKIVGGLLLMQPLHVVSTLPVVDSAIRDYMRRCLMWIGTNMGIGQACLMAKVFEIPIATRPPQRMRDGYTNSR
ncbi:hypothetical protein N7468_010017 [Penicillium chermesinum]|uniref:Uncharacterized protein n=1 Tax=Penicillium chermesinum TaxID=63820 RepID=A0A9W9TC49_9EURO|nr:uncharacterized protein N7468_010017 [Penicillium chermesinum]KAJ5217009.1 hypothetical protein N7468_010017 [Penicillium chermesinum]